MPTVTLYPDSYSRYAGCGSWDNNTFNASENCSAYADITGNVSGIPYNATITGITLNGFSAYTHSSAATAGKMSVYLPTGGSAVINNVTLPRTSAPYSADTSGLSVSYNASNTTLQFARVSFSATDSFYPSSHEFNLSSATITFTNPVVSGPELRSWVGPANAGTGTSRSLTLPASVQAGDTIVLVAGGVDAGGNLTGWPADFTLAQWLVTDKRALFYKIADGSEGGQSRTFTFASNNILIYVGASVAADGGIPEASHARLTGVTSANMPAITPSRGAADYLVLCATLYQTGNLFPSLQTPPANYWRAATGVYGGLSVRNLNMSTTDPESWTWSSTTVTLDAVTIAIPKGGSTGNSLFFGGGF